MPESRDYTKVVDGIQIRKHEHLEEAWHKFDIVKWETCEPKIVTNPDTHKREVVTKIPHTIGWLVWDGCFSLVSNGLLWLTEQPTQAAIDVILDFAERKDKELMERL